MATVGQLFETFSALTNRARASGWDSLDQDSVQAVLRDPDGLAKNFVLFMRNGACLNLGDFTITLTPFNPKEFLGEGWEVIQAEHDVRNNDLTTVNFSKVEFVTCLKEGETRITGEVNLARLKAGNHIRLGASTFLGLWKDYEARKENSVLEALYRSKGITYIDFFGDVLQGPHRYRCVLSLCRDDDGQWGWDYDWLGLGWDSDYPAAVLAS